MLFCRCGERLHVHGLSLLCNSLRTGTSSCLCWYSGTSLSRKVGGLLALLDTWRIRTSTRNRRGSCTISCSDDSALRGVVSTTPYKCEDGLDQINELCELSAPQVSWTRFGSHWRRLRMWTSSRRSAGCPCFFVDNPPNVPANRSVIVILYRPRSRRQGAQQVSFSKHPARDDFVVRNLSRAFELFRILLARKGRRRTWSLLLMNCGWCSRGSCCSGFCMPASEAASAFWTFVSGQERMPDIFRHEGNWLDRRM